MNARTLIKNASKSHDDFLVASEKAAVSRLKRDELLEEALPYVSNVNEAILILSLTSDKATRSLAWEKAVTLLPATAKAIDTLIILKKCDYYPSASQHLVQGDLKRKETIIVSKVTDTEVLFELYTIRGKVNEEGLERNFEYLAAKLTDLDELEQLYGRYKPYIYTLYSIHHEHMARIKKECEEKAAEFNELAQECGSVDDLYKLYNQFRPWLSDSLNKIVVEHEKRIKDTKEVDS